MFIILEERMPKTKIKCLNNTQRKIVRKCLSQKQELKKQIPFAKLMKQRLFYGIDIKDLKYLFKNEERCIQDEERRKQVMARKREEWRQREQEGEHNQAPQQKQMVEVNMGELCEYIQSENGEINALRASIRKQEEDINRMRAQHEEEVSRIRRKLQEIERHADSEHVPQLVSELIRKDKKLKDQQQAMENQR